MRPIPTSMRGAVLHQRGDVLADRPADVVDSASSQRAGADVVDDVAHLRVSMSGSSTGTRMSRSKTLMKLSPIVQGICGLTCAITRPALSAALLTMSTEMPRLQRPCSSGGVTWIKRHVEGHLPAGEEPGDVGEEDRRVVAVALLDDVAHVGGHEEAC